MISKIGVIGAGQMGSGIAQTFATAGYDVILHDRADTPLKRGLESIEKNLGRQASRNKISEQQGQDVFARITGTTNFSEFKNSDLVIEAATENEDLKKEIFKGVTPHLNKHAILATNTSSISITSLASVTDRPEKVIGMHFMNPVPVMQLVEVIRGLGTDDETYTSIICLLYTSPSPRDRG